MDYSKLAEFINSGNTVHCESDNEANELMDILTKLGYTIGFDTKEWIDKLHTRFFSFGTTKPTEIHTCITGMFRGGGICEQFSSFKEDFESLPDTDDLPPVSELLGLAM